MSSSSSSPSPEHDSSDNDEGRTSTSGDLSLVAGTAAAAMVAEAMSSAIASVEGDTAGAEAGATGPPLGEQVQQQVQQLDEQVCASTTLLHVCALFVVHMHVCRGAYARAACLSWATMRPGLQVPSLLVCTRAYRRRRRRVCARAYST